MRELAGRFVLVCALLLAPTAAYAQEFGVRGGVTAAPAFAFGGLRFAFSPPSAAGLPQRPSEERLRMRLELDVAGGPQPATMFTWAIESPKIHRATMSWAPYFGGGLSVFIAHQRSLSGSGDLLGAGWCFLAGVENRRRVSMELQINLFAGGDMPRAFLIAGYRFH